MAIIFDLNESGKVTLYPYGITNGNDIIPCENETYANNLLKSRPYKDGAYVVIQSDEPSAMLLKCLEGMRFDGDEYANLFINGGGYLESILARVEDIELVIAEMIGGAE